MRLTPVKVTSRRIVIGQIVYQVNLHREAKAFIERAAGPIGKT